MIQEHPSISFGKLSEEKINRGLAASPTQPVELRAGELELIFEPETGWVRRIRLGKRELVRAIYGAVRDRNWRTIEPAFRDVAIRENGADGFEIRFTAECREADVYFVWEGLIQGGREGVQFQFDGRACGDFLRNRIGLCVLLPLEGCVGEDCSVEHCDGTLEHSTMPEPISPHQPFRELRVFLQKIDGDAILEVRLDGDVFEMEDQRNWTDASFKIYSTPLDRPFPVRVQTGDAVRQKVTVTIGCEAGSEPSRVEVVPCSRGVEEKCTVQVDFSRLRSKPRMGLGFADGGEPCRGGVLERLRSLRLDHLRVDCRMWEEGWAGRLKLADAEALAIGCGLQIAVHFSEKFEEELRGLVHAAGSLRAPVRGWLVLHQQDKCVPPELADRVGETLKRLNAEACVAAGTDANFAELNRNRPPAGSNWFPCFSINPQVHASDNRTLIENLAGQTEVVKTARLFSEKPLVISPITLLPRNNPDATGAASGANEPAADFRQYSLFAAGWTLGSLAALTASHPVHSLTYFETTGKRGILETGETEETSAAFHVFVGFAELAELAEVRFGGDQTSLRFSALAGLTRSGQSVLWVANLTGEPASIRVLTGPDIRFVRLHEMHGGNRGEWGGPGMELRCESGSGLAPGVELELPEYGLVRLTGIA